MSSSGGSTESGNLGSWHLMLPFRLFALADLNANPRPNPRPDLDIKLTSLKTKFI